MLHLSRRSVTAFFASLMLATMAAMPAQSSEEAAWAALSQGGIMLLRHANAPGVGDPAGMRIGDCTTQRNLDEGGRAQARRIGEAFRARGVAVGQVLTSQWCRTRETAELAFPGRQRDEPAFNSFFDAPAKAPAQTSIAQRILQDWRGPGALVVSTHHVNIAELTGIAPASGEGIVVRFEGNVLRIVGRITP